MNRDYVDYCGKKVSLVYKDIDCCVVGGGTAGAAAAISACLSGISVLVVEKGIVLGGSQTQSLVTPMMSSKVENNDLFINSLIKSELKKYGDNIIDEFKNSGWFNSEILSEVLQNLVLDNGGKILYNALIIDSVRNGSEITHIIVNTIEGMLAISAKTLVDATGDAVLSRLSGVECAHGDANGKNQSVSFRFEMGGIDIQKLYEYMQSKGDKFCQTKPPFYEIAMVPGRGFVLEEDFFKGVKNGELEPGDIKYFQAFSIPSKLGVMSFNCPEIPDSRNAVSALQISDDVIKGRSMIRRMSKFLIKNIPGFETAYLNREASALGIRESYRIHGIYTLSEEDYFNKRKFEDAVAKTAYYVDIHSEELINKFQFEKGEYYEIPYKCMIVNEISNLIVAGRCVSASFMLQSSLRIQTTCRDMGEAAGKACAYSVKNGVSLNEIDWGKAKDFQLKLIQYHNSSDGQ